MIDAHHHLWELSAVTYPWLEAKGVVRFFGDPTPIQRDYLIEEFTTEAGGAGLRGSVHVQAGTPFAWDEARWIDAVAAANPHWPMVQVAGADLCTDDFADDLDRLKDLPSVRGIRHIVGRAHGTDEVNGSNDILDDPRFLDGLKLLGTKGLSFDLQLVPGLMAKTAELLAEVPETPVALCHAGSPPSRTPQGIAEWAGQLRALSALPHVTCKVSGLGMFDHHWTADSMGPVVQEVLDQFGPDRVMFGSNFPVDKLYSTYDTLMSAYQSLIPDAAKRAVFHDTAARFYRFSL